MKLLKLEMYGFKSFARKTEIQFEDGITAIIGPNGSGKSNISDAVRWVLGEQSAKALRGSKMEDVIFNGTENRRPLAYCEVSLTFDNADHELLTDFEEVGVTRRMYRSGESEYFINGTGCRRKDIADLFRDTGVGKDGYSIIGQGKVEEILSNKSQDRRNAFEEAAGVMKYRVRKEEAERKLESTKNNIERLKDILDELIKQLGPLEEQSAAAREYLRLRDELRDLEINIFLYQYGKLNDKLKSLDESMAEINAELNEKRMIDEKLAADCAAGDERSRKLGDAISEINAKLLSATTGVEERAGESKVYGERLSGLMRERERAETNIIECGEKLDSLGRSINGLRETLEEKTAECATKKKECAAETEALSKMDRDIAQQDQELERKKGELIDAMNRLSDAKIFVSRFDTIRGTIVERIEAIEKGKTALREKHDKLSEEYAREKDEFDNLRALRDECAFQQQSAAGTLNETNSALIKAREDAHRAEQQSEAGNARLKVLEEMKRAHEGYYASVRSILRDSERDPALSRSIEGVVAELIRVPTKYETAIEMSLGASAQNIITGTEEDAKRVIEHLRRNGYGRATFLPVSVMRPRNLDEREMGFCTGAKGYIGVASELIDYDERYRGVVGSLLGRTVIVDDVDAGIAINRRAHGAFRIATLKGDIINPGGSMTGGSVQKREFSIVGREREIEELKARSETLAAERERLEKEALRLGKKLEEANDTIRLTSEALHAREVELAARNEKVEIVKEYVDAANDELSDADAEIQRLNDSIADIDAQFSNAEKDQTEIETGNDEARAEIQRSQEALYALRREYATRNEAAADMRVGAMALEKECGGLKNETERLEREKRELEQSVERDRLSVEGFAGQLEALTGEIKAIEGRIESERHEVESLTERLGSMEEERAKHMRMLDEARARRDDISAVLGELGERQHRAELNKSRAEMELTSMQDRIWEEYELTYENAKPFERDIAVTATHVRIGEIKAAIKELGNVNVNSIDDYRAVYERHESLNVQYDDLVKAEADLRKLIEELVSTMEKEFRRQFSLIQENFSAVFVELFGGGKAELLLSDENDILNCNIDIVAQPPGKKLQLLSLLSGGERALTAIALLFAILKLKPTAFCILDEIETSLDEVNVSTVAQYLKRYSDKTQFIMITHRKGSMEVCNALYGVAMEEKGISKVVSAKFDREGEAV